jgi:hypothetical protein
LGAQHSSHVDGATHHTGLPDGIFFNQPKSQFGLKIIEKVRIPYGQLEYFSQAFGIFYDHLVIYIVAFWYIFPLFGTLCQEKSGNPGFEFESFRFFSKQEGQRGCLMHKKNALTM